MSGPTLSPREVSRTIRPGASVPGDHAGNFRAECDDILTSGAPLEPGVLVLITRLKDQAVTDGGSGPVVMLTNRQWKQYQRAAHLARVAVWERSENVTERFLAEVMKPRNWDALREQQADNRRTP